MRAEHTAGAACRRGVLGFTLLEVLVAVLLLGLALTALVRLAGLEARATAQVRDATFAQWVAANALAETRLREPFPPPGRRAGEAQMAGRRWRWQLDVQPTEVDSIRRLDVQVFAEPLPGAPVPEDEAGATASLTGFAVRP